jgi:DNA-binding PadR family transcriptional regulator
MYGKAHGYQVRRELLTWSADKWANVKPGSIYHALKKMADEELLAEVDADTDAAARGPDRTAYRLTDAGETEFQLLLARSLTDSDDTAQSAYRLMAGITFMTALPRDRAVSLLRHRLTRMEGQRATSQDLLSNGSSWGQPAHVDELYRLWLANTEAMIGWLRQLIDRLEGGEYVMADDEGLGFGAPPLTS